MPGSAQTPAPAGVAIPRKTAARPVRPLTRLRLALRAAGIEQVCRLLGCALTLAGAHAIGTIGDRFAPPGSLPSRRQDRNARALRRVVDTLGALKGIFVKAGQFAAVRHDLLPGPVTEALAGLRDRVPPLPFDRLRETLEIELGAPLTTLFSEFDRTPLGAASLAQVHRARLPSGQTVAVKIQYPWLRAALPADLALVRRLLRLFAKRVRGVDVERILDEFGAGLVTELDFEHEAGVAEEIAANLAGDPRIVVPAPVRTHCSRRVLTMSYHPAVPVSDARGLAERGVDPRAVLETIARAYAKQVFADGLFHADPHPGNLFVIDEPSADRAPRVLFIDFGLSRRLTPELRRELRQGLFALVQRDVTGFIEGMERMGMIAPDSRPGVSAAVSGMFERIADAGGALGTSGDRMLALKTEAKQLLQQTPGLQLPADLLLYAKTVSYVFALGAAIAPDVDVMKLSLPYLLQFLAKAD